MAGRPPVVVTGAHRSGTSLVVDLLAALGVFFGHRLDPNRESYFFLRRNEWVLRRAGGAWDHPLPARAFLADGRFAAGTLGLLAGDVGSTQFSEFSGKLAFLATAGTRGDQRPWGWKDPRSAFTFELWRRIFPQARLLVIHRNGVDAAHSLHVREAARWADGRAVEDALRMRPLRRRLRETWRRNERLEGYFFSTRCLSLVESFRLWEEYAGQSQDVLESYEGPRLCVRYEDLLSAPAARLAEIAAFCGAEASPAAIEQAAAHVRPSRALAFLQDERLRGFYREVRGSSCMRRLGYADLER